MQEDILLNAFCATRIGRGWCGRSPSTPLVSVVALALVKMRGSCACNISYWTLYSQREGKEANVDYLTLILLRGWTSMNRGVCNTTKQKIIGQSENIIQQQTELFCSELASDYVVSCS